MVIQWSWLRWVGSYFVNIISSKFFSIQPPHKLYLYILWCVMILFTWLCLLNLKLTSLIMSHGIKTLTVADLTKPKGNVPLYLSCGHSMCESCIANIVKFEEPLECKMCHRDTTISAEDLKLLSQNKIKLYQLFPVNLTMLGELSYHLMEVSFKCLS